MSSESLYKKYLISTNDNYFTPTKLLAELDAEFHFDGPDPCSINPEGLREFDGLGDWVGKTIFINPPYSKPVPWIQKAIEESKKGKTIVMLLKNDRSTKWFHDLVKPNTIELRDIRGRVTFSSPNRKIQWHAPFPSLVVVFKGAQ